MAARAAKAKASLQGTTPTYPATPTVDLPILSTPPYHQLDPNFSYLRLELSIAASSASVVVYYGIMVYYFKGDH